MKASDVKIGDVFMVRVGQDVCPVEITFADPFRGWNAVNLRTGHSIYIKTAARLRCRCNRDGSAISGDR